MSWKPEVIAERGGKFVGNALRFATKEEAEANVRDLASRWFMVTATRVVESEDPVNYSYVDGKLVAVEPTWKKNALAATKNTQLGAIIACALGVETPHPCFVGKACVTSDHFITCNFIDKDGEGRMGAFVGGVGDLARNAHGLARHLKLNDEDKAALFSALREWISTDYSDGSASRALKVA